MDDIYMLLIFSTILTTVSFVLLAVLAIHTFKMNKKINSIESKWNSYILGSHTQNHKYPLHHT